ncbi:MAG: TrbI/VirB10 family protein [Pseudomonadota bacterium]|nr:TrbI/VirB10 family protein [Pseudomonadota bacterium]
MEVVAIKERLSKILLKEALPLTKKRDVNWSAVKKFAGIGIGSAVLVLLVMPTPKEEQKTFHEKTEGGTTAQSFAQENNPTQDALAQLQAARTNVGAVPNSLDYLYQGSSGSGAGKSQDRNSSMILTRGGLDSKTQLSSGCRINVRLLQTAIVANQAMPVIGLVANDVIQEDSVAIPQGSKLLGDVSFDESTERAQISWKSIQFPDGKERQIAAIGVSPDGQVGVEGKVHSEALKNIVGQTLTRFIGAYAEGSMQTGAFGANQGGSENGMKKAVADTAKDRAEAWGEDMKKEKKWIELKAGSEFYAVITQTFVFRDPGATNGR